MSGALELDIASASRAAGVAGRESDSATVTGWGDADLPGGALVAEAGAATEAGASSMTRVERRPLRRVVEGRMGAT